jgi:hypothetical protein
MEELWKIVPEFAQFKGLFLEEKPLFDKVFNVFPPVISEFTFTNLFIWRHTYQLKVSRFKNFLCLLSDQEEKSFFFPPVGEGEMMECYRILLQYLEGKGSLPQIARVPEAVVSQKDWKEEGFVAELDRAQSDYIYLTEDLIKLEGRKYHRKRNHIKQFEEKYPYQYVPLTPEWISECLRLETEWCDLRHCEVIPGLLNESIAIKEAFTHFEALGLKGGAILIDGKVEAFTLGEPLNRDTVVIHIEKANSAYEGLYALINQAFLENEWPGYTYVNREQDLGEEGLRKAKESYFPHHMVNKYTITLAGLGQTA